MAQKQILVISCNGDGILEETLLDSADILIEQYEQIGIDDCSTDLSLRGYPVVKGLVGPIPESRTVVRYETAPVFEQNTKEWAATKTKRRRRTRAAIEAEAAQRATNQATIPAPLTTIHASISITSETV